MIKKFSAKNVRTFNEFNIDFSINKSKRTGEFTNDDDFLKIKNDKILKIIGITGANASGKTTLLEMFKLYELWTYHYDIYVNSEKKVNNFFRLQDLENAQKQGNKQNHIISDQNDWLNTAEYINKIYDEFINEFNLLFNTNCFVIDKPIIYKVNFINDKNDELEHYLEINKNGSIIFKLNNISTNEMIIDHKSNYLLDHSTIFNIKTNIMFETFYNNIKTLSVEVSSLFESNPISIENFVNPSLTLNSPNKAYRDEVNNSIYEYTKIGDNKTKFIEWLELADSTISNINYNDRFKTIDYFIKKNGDSVRWNNLSKGTLKWIYFFYILYINDFDYILVKEGFDRIIFIDEIDNYLHLKLVKTFLRAIKCSNENIQIIFTTHNPNLFDTTFRHQAIFLIENDPLDNTQYTHKLVCLTKYNLKKDKLISKLFLDERVGSYPNGSLIIDWLKKYAK